MTNRLRIILVFGCVLVAAAVAPAGAPASPLLSGYGGPGQGNQAILGSTLLGGSGGGGSSSGATAASASAGETSGASIAAPTGSQPATASAAGTSAGSHGSTSSGAVRHSAIAPVHGALPASLAYARAEHGSSPGDSGLFGLSGADLLYAALVLGALALTTVLMRRLMRPTPAKGHG